MLKNSSAITDLKQNTKVSNMVTAFKKLDEQIQLKIDGQYDCKVKIKCGNSVISSDDIDIEFSVDFDDDVSADSAEITMYNLTENTINQFAVNNIITIEAGYGEDTGIIFTGYVTNRKSRWNDVDKIVEIRAIDDQSREEMNVESISYAAGTTASYILKDLCGRVGLPIAVFKTERDYTYTDETNVDGDLSGAIQQYANVCKVSAYICKSKIYVRPLNDGDNTQFELSSDTGLLSVEEFEEKSESSTEGFVDTIKGFDVEMLGQHRIQTASIITLNSKNYKGTFRVKEGTHSYSYNSSFTTKAKIVEV